MMHERVYRPVLYLDLSGIYFCQKDIFTLISFLKQQQILKIEMQILKITHASLDLV